MVPKRRPEINPLTLGFFGLIRLLFFYTIFGLYSLYIYHRQ